MTDSENSLDILKERADLETIKHKQMVMRFCTQVATALLARGIVHDNSKLESPESETFALYTNRLKNSTYGSDEYKKFLEEMKPALDHHYANNMHHPEHYKNGVNDMTLIDLIEMMCDWKAATLRHNDGNIRKSIEINAKRFNIDHQLESILTNTIRMFDETD